MERYANVIDAIEDAQDKAFKRPDGTVIVTAGSYGKIKAMLDRLAAKEGLNDADSIRHALRVAESGRIEVNADPDGGYEEDRLIAQTLADRSEPEADGYPIHCHMLIVSGDNWNYLPLAKARCSLAHYSTSGWWSGYDSEKDWLESLSAEDDQVVFDAWASTCGEGMAYPVPVAVRSGRFPDEAIDMIVRSVANGHEAAEDLNEKLEATVLPEIPEDRMASPMAAHRQGVCGTSTLWLENDPDKQPVAYLGKFHGPDFDTQANRRLPDTPDGNAGPDGPVPGIGD